MCLKPFLMALMGCLVFGMTLPLLVKYTSARPTTTVDPFCGCPTKFNACIINANAKKDSKEECKSILKSCLIACPDAPTDDSQDSYIFAPAQAKHLNAPYLGKKIDQKRSTTSGVPPVDDCAYLRDYVRHGNGCGCDLALEQCLQGEIGKMDLNCLNTAHTCLLACTVPAAANHNAKFVNARGHVKASGELKRRNKAKVRWPVRELV